ncbi:hypothetical protein [Ligilactobacillus saerimneri]|uniref:hypothetical protein n=1 Tax=Ligilactobacillus saerimneri TaxID=228229 RepID=UPI00242DB007|nr:hypothetical protein [Ligilactobacillus saerimneri]
MIKFTDIAKGDEPGVDKINKNFDMVEQALNLEERKEIPIPLSSGWKVVNNNSLKLVITPVRAWLYGDVSGVSGSSAPYGYNNPIVMAVPTSTTFRNKNYSLKGVYAFCPVGGHGGNTTTNGVRVLCDSAGRLYLDEPSDKVKDGTLTVNIQLDMIEA